ncbi:MAG: hypothetical protein LBU08_00265 [Tannerellaceae bacterium]|jgi:hypothetical protein|nr:hypothetical protein [Tannerellaceae bacterium]
MNNKILLLSFLSLILPGGTMQAATYYVNLLGSGNSLGDSPQNACTLPKALEWARPSDIIRIVEEGVYALPDSATFRITKNLTLVGVDGVRLSAGKGRRTMLIHGEHADIPVTVHLESLIIQGGIANTPDEVLFGTVAIPVDAGKGGGIFNRFAHTTLKNVSVQGNIASTANDIAAFGGGIYNAANSSLSIEGGSIRDNIAAFGLQDGFGGGIFSAGQLTIVDSPDSVLISGNYAVANKLSTAQGVGGGLMCAQSGSTVVAGKLVVLNNIGTIGTGAAKGGGIAITSGILFDITGRGDDNDVVLAVRNNVAVANPTSKAEGFGGGIYVNEEETAGLADLRINTKYAGLVEITGNAATIGLGKGAGGGIAIGENGRVIFDGGTFIAGNYAINNANSSASGSGAGVYRADEAGTVIQSGNDPVIKDNIVTSGKGAVAQTAGTWILTLHHGAGFLNAPLVEVYESLLPALHISLTMAEGYHIASPRLNRNDYGHANEFEHYLKDGNTYHYSIQSASNLTIYARTQARKIIFVSNSPGITFLPGDTGHVMVDSDKNFAFSVQKTAEKYKGGSISQLFGSFVDDNGNRQQKLIEPSGADKDSFTVHYSISPLDYDTILALFDACRIVLDPPPAGENFGYREYSPLWKEGDEDVTYLAAGKPFMLKVVSYALDLNDSTPQVFVNKIKIQPHSQNSSENTFIYYIVPQPGQDSILIQSSLYSSIIFMQPLPEGLQFIPFGKDYYVMNPGIHRVRGDFNVSVQMTGSQMRDVVLLSDEVSPHFLGKDYSLRAYYFSVPIPKKNDDTLFLRFDYEGLNIVYFDTDSLYGALAVDGKPLHGIHTYSLYKGDSLSFTLAADGLRPSVSAVSDSNTVPLPARTVSKGLYEYTFPFTGGDTGIDTFFIHSTQIPHLSLYLTLPQGVSLVDDGGIELTDRGYRINVAGSEYTVSFIPGEFYRLAQPVIYCRGGEEFPDRGQDTVTFVLRNLTGDTDAVVDFLYHRVTFSLTDSDIFTNLPLNAFAIAPNSTLNFLVQLKNQIPAIIVNGKAIVASIEGDGNYGVSIPNISEDLEISVHKTALTISFQITDPGIRVDPPAAALTLAPNNDFEFFIHVAGSAPYVVVNGQTVNPDLQTDGRYKVTLPNISENLDISIRKTFLSLTPDFPQQTPVSVYTLTGRFLTHLLTIPGEPLPLPPGIYILKSAHQSFKAVCR